MRRCFWVFSDFDEFAWHVGGHFFLSFLSEKSSESKVKVFCIFFDTK